MLEQLRSVIPAPLRRIVRRALDALSAVRRMRTLRQCVPELRRQARGGAVDPQLLYRMREAWGNEGFSADLSFIAEVASRMLRTGGPFLECGSGFSTLVTGVIAEAQGSQVWSLEQDRRWYEHVRAVLGELGIGSVTLWHTPLASYGEFAWFALEGRTLPPEFGLVVCDGPAFFSRAWSEPIYSNWRMGVVPVLQGRGVRFGEILLDDAEDPRRAGLCERWAALDVPTEIVATPTGQFVIGRPAPGGRFSS